MPAPIARKTEAWFRKNQRPFPWRDGYDPYRVWVSEVMAQQTRMEVVLGFFDRFLARFPTLDALAAASDDEVTAAWSGLGYYRRARMLRDGAHFVRDRFGGRIPKSVEELRTIPGIGRYTAGAIASIAFNEAAPIVDGNVARVLARLFGDDSDPWTFASQLVATAKSPRDLNQGLMEIGALICKPRNPLCLICPIRGNCIAFAQGRTAELPRPKAKTPTRQMRIALYLVTDRAGRVLMRREAGRLMNAMFHLPHGDTSLLSGAPLAVARRARLGSFRHTVTNRRIVFEVYRAVILSREDGEGSPSHVRGGSFASLRMTPDGYTWIDVAEIGHVPHPSYVLKALRIAGMSR